MYPGITKLALEAAPANSDATIWAAQAVADLEQYLGADAVSEELASPAQLAALDAALLAHPDVHGIWASSAQALAALPAGALPTLDEVLDALEEFADE